MTVCGATDARDLGFAGYFHAEDLGTSSRYLHHLAEHAVRPAKPVYHIIRSL